MKGKYYILNKKQGVKQNPKKQDEKCNQILIFSIASIIAMLQSTIELPSVDCNQCEESKKEVFLSFFSNKNQWQKTF